MQRVASCLTALLLLTPATFADDPARELARAIDQALTADWARQNVHPAPQADDLAFLRRASLDLVGQIPSLEEVQSFLRDNSANKREKLLDRLLASKQHAVHLASVTRTEWMPQSLGNFRLQLQGTEFEAWLEAQFQKNAHFDEIARAILEAEATVGQRGMIDFGNRRETGDKQALSAFYVVADGKPEEMAAMTSRLFLGIKLECAQCHDHPFAPYTREQFWEFAAFFGEFTPLSPVAPSFVGPLLPQFESNRITIPNTTREVTARYFTGGEPVWKADRSPRRELADWLTVEGKPLFARNLANRLWAHLFGIGLIDPIDEPGEANPPNHPAVLNVLTDAAIRTKYDLRVLLKGIALSRAYQQTSRLTHPSQSDLRQFARMPTKGLTGHQIYDSLLTATGQSANILKETAQNRRFAANEAQGGTRGEFVSRFPQSNRRTESATSILQSLMLMNGKFISSLTTEEKNPLVGRLANSAGTSREAVELLFLSTLSRYPSRTERETFELYLESGGPAEDYSRAVGDLFWVLVNSTEFLLNH
ncbi:MAG: DUF1549 domain-containing protein [Gemmataceae bacterium]